MTDLQGKFAALEQALSNRLDTIITLLEYIRANQTTTTGGNADVVAALGDVIGRLDTAQSQRGSQVALETDIRNAIGSITTYPANYTVRRLLAMLQTALDGEPGMLAGPINDDPTGDCAPYKRVQMWSDGGVLARDGNNYRVWIPVFYNHIATHSVTSISAAEDARWAILPELVGSLYLCINWDFTGSIEPYDILIGKDTDFDPFGLTIAQDVESYPGLMGGSALKDSHDTVLTRFSELHELPIRSQYAQIFVLFGINQTIAPPSNMWIGTRGDVS